MIASHMWHLWIWVLTTSRNNSLGSKKTIGCMNSCPWLSHVLQGTWRNACFFQGVWANTLFIEFPTHICRRSNIEPKWNPRIFILSMYGESWISIVNRNCKVMGYMSMNGWYCGFPQGIVDPWTESMLNLSVALTYLNKNLIPPHDLFAFGCTNSWLTSKVMLVHPYILWIK